MRKSNGPSTVPLWNSRENRWPTRANTMYKPSVAYVGELLVYVFWQKVLPYLNNFTNQYARFVSDTWASCWFCTIQVIGWLLYCATYLPVWHFCNLVGSLTKCKQELCVKCVYLELFISETQGAKVPMCESSTSETFAPGSEWSWERIWGPAHPPKFFLPSPFPYPFLFSPSPPKLPPNPVPLSLPSLLFGDITYYVIIEGGGGVASLMTTDDKGEGGIDRTDDVIKTVIL